MTPTVNIPTRIEPGTNPQSLVMVWLDEHGVEVGRTLPRLGITAAECAKDQEEMFEHRGARYWLVYDGDDGDLDMVAGPDGEIIATGRAAPSILAGIERRARERGSAVMSDLDKATRSALAAGELGRLRARIDALERVVQAARDIRQRFANSAATTVPFGPLWDALRALDEQEGRE